MTINSIADSSGELLTSSEAARFLRISVGTLAVWRCAGRYNLKFVKVGSKVRYRMEDLEAFLRERTRTHTGQVDET